MAKLEKIGYGQVELNKVASVRTKEIFGQLPFADAGVVVENGMALVYDHVKGKVRFPSKVGEYAQLHQSEIILPNDLLQDDKDFALFSIEAGDLQVATDVYPRMYALTLGDTFTTNVIADSDAALKDVLIPGTDGYWKKKGAEVSAVEATVIKVYTMADGQKGLKLAVTKLDSNAEVA